MTSSAFICVASIALIAALHGGCGDDAGAGADVAIAESDGTDTAAADEAAPDAPDGDSGHDTAADATPDAEPDAAPGIAEIAVGDLVFEATSAGPPDGELVLLLHGFPQTSAAWSEQLSALAAAGYHAVAFDQRGYSPRARPEGVGSYAMPLLVDDVLGVATALGAERFHLVGHDWGAAVAWTVAGRHPERLYTLTALSTPHPDAYEQARHDPESCQAAASGYIDFLVKEGAEDTLLAANAAGLRFFWQGLDEAAVEAYLSVLGTPEALGAALNWYRANLGPDSGGFANVGPISVPTLYLWGAADPAFCEDAPSHTGEHVSGPYRFEVLEGQGHWLPELAADEVTALLLEHLAAPRPMDGLPGSR